MLNELFEWIKLNVEWVFSGVGLAAIGIIWRIFFRKESSAPEVLNKQVTVAGSITLNSDSIQHSGRDINVTQNYGVSINEVKELVEIFMKENLPKLREEAKQEANNNVQIFIDQLQDSLSKSLSKVNPNKFADPDIQSSLNDAVLEVAKKGKKIEVELLSKLLIERVSEGSSDYISLVASEAIKVLGKLTPEQINFLTLVVFMRYTVINGITSLEGLIPLGNEVLSLVGNIELSVNQRTHLEYAGCAKVSDFMTNKAATIWKNSYGFLKDVPENEIEEKINKLPVLKQLTDLFDKNQLGQISLTSVGQLIGLINLSRKVQDLNYSNWIK